MRRNYVTTPAARKKLEEHCRKTHRINKLYLQNQRTQVSENKNSKERYDHNNYRSHGAPVAGLIVFLSPAVFILDKPGRLDWRWGHTL